MTLKFVLAALLASTAPPGQTGFSVELATDCASDATTCPGARRSSFYRGWVRKESATTAAKRYDLIADVLDDEARRALCIGADGKPTCEQSKAQKRWTVPGLIAISAAVAVQESGLREDVMVGRGRSGKPSDDGGQGRGPGNERCAMQIHPSVLDDDRLLGADRDALSRCFRQGMKMLIHARHYCSWAAPKVDRTWAVVSLYGTGVSCDSANNGKTRARVELARKMYERLKRGRL